MSTVEVVKVLDKVLADSKVLCDVRSFLRNNTNGEAVVVVKLSRKKILIPVEATIDIVTKAFFKEYFEGVGFGVYKVLVAVGGLKLEPHGCHKAKHCFMTLFYNEAGDLITEDLHPEFR